MIQVAGVEEQQEDHRRQDSVDGASSCVVCVFGSIGVRCLAYARYIEIYMCVL